MTIPRMTLILGVLFLLGGAGGCVSAEKEWADRREKLLVLYPPGKTTRADVQAKFKSTPEFSLVRPEGGWATLEQAVIADHILSSQQRVGTMVTRCERYLAPDGFLGLCNCWFYYDDRDILLDAEWQYHSD